jgi:hypothetical protein
MIIILRHCLQKNMGAHCRILMVIDYYILKVLLTSLLSCLSILGMLSRAFFFLFFWAFSFKSCGEITEKFRSRPFS